MNANERTRLDRIEEKIDKLADAVVSIARAEEKIRKTVGKHKLENSCKNSRKNTCFKSCRGCFGSVFGPTKVPNKLYRGGYDQKKQ